MKHKKTKIRHHTPQNEGSLENTLKNALYSLGISLAIGLALLLIGTAVALALPDPTALIDPIGYVSLFVTAFLGGFASSKLNKRAPYLTAIICGAGFVILSMLISFALPHTLASGMNIWARLALHLLTFAVFPFGTLVSVKASKPKRRRR